MSGQPSPGSAAQAIAARSLLLTSATTARHGYSRQPEQPRPDEHRDGQGGDGREDRDDPLGGLLLHRTLTSTSAVGRDERRDDCQFRPIRPRELSILRAGLASAPRYAIEHGELL